ncbi:rRNA methyltransferase 2, mitochondrial-like [Homarus americanus]|nr:rRNA methyltransferase 2, mitochondrial-like [Homarus americanus]
MRSSFWIISKTCHFCTSSVTNKVIPKKLKARSRSSQDWLTRQLNDPYVKLAKYEQFRARSAFKLQEIDERHKILKPGQVVVECGAAPGAWTQVAVSGVNSLPKDTNRSQGVVIAVDILSIHPLPGAVTLGGKDFTLSETQQEILNVLKGRKVNLVLSDMAPNATGTKELDHENIIALAYSALRFAIQHSDLQSTFLCKIWSGFRDRQLITDMEKFYRSVKVVKPPSSRCDSSEIFLLGKKFCGLGTK